MTAPLVPELDVSDLDGSLAFYRDVCGFATLYERPAERFAYLAREGAELMLQQASGPGRRFRNALLERPFGRGVNLQIEVTDVDELYARVVEAGHTPVLELEQRRYDVGERPVTSRQFVVADPDGYLLRFFEDVE